MYGTEPKLKIGGLTVNTSNIPLIPIPSVTLPERRALLPPSSDILSVPTLVTSSSRGTDAILSVESNRTNSITSARKAPSVRSSSSVFATPTVSTLGNVMNRQQMKEPTVQSLSSNTNASYNRPKQQEQIRKIPSVKSGNKQPKLSDEVSRIVEHAEKMKTEVPMKTASAYELSDLTDPGKPDFSSMNRNQRLAYKQTLTQELKDLRLKYPNLAIDEVTSDLTLDELYDLHYSALRHIVVNNSVGTWKVGLIISWAAFEIMCTNVFNIPAKGYTEMMYAEMVKYEVLIYRWRQKKFTFASAEKDPLNEILWCSLLNAGLVIAINMVGKYMGSDIVSSIVKSVVMPVASNLTHPKVSIPGVPNPSNGEGGIMSAIENGIKQILTITGSPDQANKPPQPNGLGDNSKSNVNKVAEEVTFYDC
jgi:hypothetical protein